MTNPSRLELEPAWILHARPFRDTSLLLEVFTLSTGRVGLIARGARAPKSRLRGLLQPLQPLLLSWRQTGELGALTAAEASSMAVPLKGDPLFCAWYANELLLRLLPRQAPQQTVFAAYGLLLECLTTADWERSLRRFELTLLSALGHEPDWPFSVDSDAGADIHYTLNADGGFISVDALAPTAVTALTLMALQAGLPAHQLALDPVQLRQARGLLGQCLKRLLGEKPLQSQQLLRQLRAQKSKGLE